MSLSTLKPVSYRTPPVAGANASLSKVSKVTMMNRQTHPPLQVKGKEKPMLQESLSATSRREMLHLTVASVGLVSLLLPASAEAAARNATMRQKILQKLEELRQKVGLPTPKDEGEENKPEGKPKVHNGTKEANPKVQKGATEKKPEANDEEKHTSTGQELKVSSSEGAVIPALPGIINGKSAETTLP